MKKYVFLFLICIGCGSSNQQNKAPKLESAQEESMTSKVLSWGADRLGWQKSNEQDMSPEERDKYDKKRQEALAKIHKTDKKVRDVIEELGKEVEDSWSGFKHVDAPLDFDAWDQRLQVSYTPKDAEEILTVRSAGPDGLYETADDVTHTKRTARYRGYFDQGNIGWIFVGIILWVIAGSLAVTISYAKNRVLNRSSKTPPLSREYVVIIFALGPVAILLLFGMVILDYMKSASD